MLEADVLEAEAPEAEVLETAEQVEDVEGISEEGGEDLGPAEAPLYDAQSLEASMITVGGKAVTGNAEDGYTTTFTAGYNKVAVEPEVIVTGCEKDVDFEVSYADNNAVGDATVTVTPKGGSEKLTGSAITIKFAIKSLVLNVTDWNYTNDENITVSSGKYYINSNISLNNSIFSSVITTTNKMELDTNNKSIDNFSFTKRLKFGGKGKTTDLAVSFTAEKAGTLTVYGMSSSSDTTRNLLLTPNGTTETAKLVNDGNSIAKLTAPVEKGTYYLYGSDGAYNIYYIALEYTNTETPPAEAADLSKATIAYTVDGEKKDSATFTGKAIDFDVIVTVDEKVVDSKYYDETYARDPYSDYQPAGTADLTNAGGIKVKVAAKSDSEAYYTGEKEADSAFTINKADLTAPNADNTTVKLDLAGTYSEELTFNVAELFADVPDAANLKYVYDGDSSNLADIIKTGSVSAEADGTLKYSIADDFASASNKTAELKVKVSSDNYNELTVTITVEMMEKTAVTATIVLPEKTYDGEAYNANEKAEITVTDPTEDTDNKILNDLKENLVFTFTAKGAENSAVTAPVNAGEYDVAVTLDDNSDYKLKSEITGVTLTINAKELTITPKNKNWYAGSAALVTGKAKASDYTHTEMVEGDSITTQPTFKYCKTGTDTELTTEEWTALAAGNTVDIVASEADAGSNYDIKYAKGTLTVVESTPLAPNEHELNLTKDWSIGEDGKFANNTGDTYFTVAGEQKTASTGNTYPLITYGEYTTVLKMNKSGKVSFKAPEGSELELIVHIQVNKDGKINVDDSTAVTATEKTETMPASITASNGVTLVKDGDGTIVEPYADNAPTDNTAIHKITMTLGAGTDSQNTHTITNGNKGEFQLYYVKVTEPESVNPPVTTTVKVTPTISDTESKLGTSKIYLRPEGTTGESDLEVISGTELTLTVNATYTLVVKNADGSINEDLSALINEKNTYTAKADETAVTIVVADKTNTPNPPTPGEVSKPTADPNGGRRKLGTTVTLSASDADEILYEISVNGNNNKVPDANNGDIYRSPITLDTAGDVIIKAVAVKGGVASDVATFTYEVYEASDAGLEIVLNKAEYTYTGSAIIPDYSVTYNGEPLTEGTDYTVKCSGNVKVGDGKAKITVTGKGNLSGSTYKTFSIKQKSLAYNDDENGTPEVEGDAIVVAEGAKASPVFTYNGVKLTAKDFEFADASYKNYKWTAEDNGKKVTINAGSKGSFKDSREVDVIVIAKADQKNVKIKVTLDKQANNLIYNGQDQEVPAEYLTVTNGAGAELVKDTDYIVSYPSDIKSAGKKKITIVGISPICMGSVSKTYTIKPALKTGTVEVTVGTEKAEDVKLPFVSTGVTFDPEDLTVTYTDADNKSVDLDLGTEYKIAYSSNKKAGTAKYTVTGLGNYKGVTKKGTFTIETAGLDSVKVIIPDKLYTKANAFKSTPVLIEGDTVLKASNYKVTYCSDEDGTVLKSVEAGQTVYVKIEGKGGYADSTRVESYTVKASEGKDLSTAKIKLLDENGKSKFPHTGEPVKPAQIVITYKDKSVDTLELKDGEYTCKDNTDADYDIDFVSNVSKGKATVIIQSDNAAYAVGGKTATFSISAKSIKDLFQ